MESSQAIDTAKHVLLIFSVILGCGSVIGFVAQKIKVPDIVLFLLAGIVLGPQVADVIEVNAASALNEIILIFGASYILFDGGATSHLRVLKGVWITLLLLATIGVLITAVIVAPVAAYVFGVPFLVALLIGATMAPTDPATLMPVFKQVRVKARVAQTVISESAFNDATGSVIALTVLAILVGGGHFSATHALLKLAEQSLLGIAIGGVLGYVALFVIAHEKYSFLREYMPLVSLLVVVGAYLGAEDAESSGFMAAFVAGVVLGNQRVFGFAIAPQEQKSLEEFVETTSLIMRMFIFILLGSQVKFSLLLEHWLGAVIVVIVFVFVARPVNVFCCALPDRRAKWSLKELLFMCWVRETGVIPSALAGILVAQKAPHAHLISSVVFVAVLITILMQATTTKWWATKLDLLEESEADGALQQQNHRQEADYRQS